MSENKIYELRRDIWTPALYIKAGFRKTEAEWKERLGDFNIKWQSDWFIDIEKEATQKPKDKLKILIDAVFEEKGLYSLTYKDAARQIAEAWLKQNKQK
jgi:hypothetical protein